ncbi:MAG TPA: hypothetical protein VK179_03230 [Bacteroidales bacterium]|nr:hypothetical protein [Bacteroidales bacterium]
MIKLKTRPVFIALFLAGMLVLSGRSPDDPFIEYLQQQLEKYNQNFNSEKAFLMTDRFVYRPGEDLWFKGFVSSVIPAENITNDFFIRLINSKGEPIIYRRYPLVDNETSGHMIIPRSCVPGKYWLIAYTGWMKNQCPQEAFRKEILISKYFERRYQVEVNYDRSFYSPSDTMNALVKIADAQGKPMAQTEFDYVLGTLNKSEVKGEGITDVKGKCRINCIIPANDDLLMLSFDIKNRKTPGTYAHVIPVITKNISVSVFPEGGRLVKGIRSKVAFRSVDRYNLPERIKGIITDMDGEFIDSLKTGDNGMGYIEFTPLSESSLLKIVSPEALENVIAFPPAMDSGIIIRFNGLSGNEALFEVRSNYNRQISTYWTAVKNQKMIWAKQVSFRESSTVKIPLINQKSGIIQVNVFDEQHHVVAERSFAYESQYGILNVSMERHVYKTRQRVSVLVDCPKTLMNKDLTLSVSLSKLAHNAFDRDLNSIVQVTGCDQTGVQPDSDDLALLTSGFSELDWAEVLDQTPVKTPYVQLDGLSGVVYDKKENISPHAKVRITHFPNFRLYETQTDENGSFRVSFGSDIIDYRFLNIDAYDATGKVNLNTKIDYSYVQKLADFTENQPENSEMSKIKDLVRYGEPDLVYFLRYGPGKFREKKTDTHKKYDPYQYSKYTDIMDIIQDIKPYRLSEDRIIFTEPLRSNTDTTVMIDEAIIVINGSLKGNKIGALKNILPSDITNINISTSAIDVHKYTPLNFKGVIEITTIQGTGRYRQSSSPAAPGIISAAEKQFYSPDYSIETSYSADNRRTLYWNPKIQYQGNSMLVTFYTSDIKGLFFGHVAGIDDQGNPVEGSFSFEVE